MKISDMFRKREDKFHHAIGVQVLGADIRVAVVENVAGGLRLKRCDRFKVTPSRTPAEILKAGLDGMGIENAAVVMVMDPSRYRLLSIEAPDIEPENQMVALRAKAAELLDYDIDRAEIDFVEIPGRDAKSRSGQYYVAAAEKEYLSSLASTVEGGDVELKAIDVSELAIRNVVALEPNVADGVLLLDLQSGSPRMYLFRSEQLYLVRPLKVNVKKLVAELSPLDALSDDQSASDELSLVDGDSEPGEQSSVEFDGMVLQLTRSLSYFQRNLGQKPIVGVLLMPPDMSQRIASSDGELGSSDGAVGAVEPDALAGFSEKLSKALSLPVTQVAGSKLGFAPTGSARKTKSGESSLAAMAKPAKLSEMLPAIGAAVRAAS